ncbi:MAG: flavin reductase [Lachnospiraceae bacterium]|nr:flavin reductase [Robinsoniella sp.]MDY3766562.1 flavin reductase [Lachnospiraceae bacterium]
MFKEISIQDLNFNPFSKIGKEWMLITAGNSEHCNTMTASWGALGVWWGKNAITCYIRQSRYTKEFVDQNDTFTISFFDESYRKALSLCGSVSGRDCDKIKEASLTPVAVDETTAFEEASMVFVCKKLYADEMPAGQFIAKEMDEKWYPTKDYHTMYIAEITKVLVKA